MKWWDKLLFLFGRRRAYRVEGDSMMPTLRHGDNILVDPFATISTGDIVAANHPYKKSVKLIKRVHSFDDRSGRIVLHGDNPDSSTDSRSFGTISISEVLGKVICRIK